MRSTAAGALLLALGLAAVGLGLFVYYPVSPEEAPEEMGPTVTIEDANGTELATVEVRLAETFDERYTGLSKTDSLENGTGMLFVHPDEGQQTYVMRNMSFAIDIIFIDSNGTVTRIHHASVPEEGGGPYPGRGKYVLEVPRGWSNATGVDVGDTVTVPESAEAR